MIKEILKQTDTRGLFLPREECRPFPGYDDRAAWEGLPDRVKEHFLSKERETLEYDTTALTATKYLECYRTGSDSAFVKAVYPKRDVLVDALISECIRHDGRYIDKIIDLVWSLCEESSWIGPRHNNHMHNHMLTGVMQNALPDVLDFNFVDLFAGSTAGVLSWVYYFLKEPLDAVTPMVCERIEIELMKRIVWPFMHHDDFTWFGCYGHKINNWNPFIVNNLISVGTFCVKDPDLRRKFLLRCMEKLDIYLSVIPADGGCDEGPSYWNMAGASVFDCFCGIKTITGGKLDFCSIPVIRDLAEYFVKANLTEDCFANFADNHCHTTICSDMLFRFGEATGSALLKAFALDRYVPDVPEVRWSTMNRGLADLFLEGNLPEKTEPYVPGSYWLPDTQILFARDRADRVQLAAKAGFNNESHNHNDLGTFILLKNGEPLFPDLGSLPYTPKTFSPQRYEIWILQSAWHNCVSVNGFDQLPGDDVRAENVEYREEGDVLTLRMELRGAYPAEAGVRSLVRELQFDRADGKLTVTDTLETARETADAEVHYVTVREPKVSADSVTIRCGEATARMCFDPDVIKPELLSLDPEDDGQKEDWGSDLFWKTSFRPVRAGSRHVFRVEID